jgi:hypothetical protein
VIHKSLWDVRPLWYSCRDGHAEGEHVNRGRDSQVSVLPYRCSLYPFCCVCLGCCTAEFGSSGGTYELLSMCTLKVVVIVFSKMFVPDYMVSRVPPSRLKVLQHSQLWFISFRTYIKMINLFISNLSCRQFVCDTKYTTTVVCRFCLIY